ncbi:4'-phosphopantetheinyl transferase family protein [Streptomyces sp. CRN 30]|uniref:4'-phosphopantetheinyl transferase family protein n=1 Tax=Streptomyces sp. CRN 30 TaxID=3075613 RepID=UPI002A7F1858|nr:4'-phosphopantetheinyl transferase superfamily protein [Streptomyces sp. CRN 30]
MSTAAGVAVCVAAAERLGASLWTVRAPAPDAPPDVALLDVLDAAERRRAAALRRPAERALYVAAHGALRRLLGDRLGVPPAEVELTRLPCPGCGGPHGRPAVAGSAGDAVHFSLSHTAGLALVALAARPVGVDVERVPEPRLAEDAARSLHRAERAELALLSAGARPGAFARCWTRKEAYLKATGEGLSGDALRGHFLGTGVRPAGLPGWTVTDVEVPAGWAAACVVRDPVRVSGPGAPRGRRRVPCASTGSRGRR